MSHGAWNSTLISLNSGSVAPEPELPVSVKDLLRKLDHDAVDSLDISSVTGKLRVVEIAARLSSGASGLSGLLHSTTLHRWTSQAGHAFATVARVFAGQNIVAEIVLRYGGHRSPDTCDGVSFVSTVFRGAVECKELVVASQPPGREDRGYVSQALGAPSEHSADRLMVSSKFVLGPGRGLVLEPSGILTMKAIKDSLELRVSKVTVHTAQPMYFWKAEGAVDPGVPVAKQLESGKWGTELEAAQPWQPPLLRL
jgi:hypothetical protein